MLDEEIKGFLQRNRIILNTDLGQHFLVDQDALDDIVNVSNVGPDDNVIEIGPGIGVLTRELLRKAKHVTAIEIDPRFIPLLTAFVDKKTVPKLTVINGSALDTRLPSDEPYKVVANIPYHITSPLMRHLLMETERLPESLTLLIQLEVAENITSETGSNLVGILAQLYGKPIIARKVKPELFLPPPKVDSAVLHMECFPTPLVDRATARKILNLAKSAFSQRRKMLSNTIAKLPGGSAALEACGIDHKRRPETLTIHEWIALQQAIGKNP